LADDQLALELGQDGEHPEHRAASAVVVSMPVR